MWSPFLGKCQAEYSSYFVLVIHPDPIVAHIELLTQPFRDERVWNGWPTPCDGLRIRREPTDDSGSVDRFGFACFHAILPTL
jgi:hypothetical protein